MKKMVRLLSVVMLIAMCFSLASVGAFADNGPLVVVGGNTQGSSSGSAPFSYGGATENVADASGAFVDNSSASAPAASATSKEEVQQAVSNGTTLNAPSDVTLDTVVDTMDFSAYTTDSNVNLNLNYIKYVLTCYKNGTITSDSAEMTTAIELFGEVMTYGMNQIDEARSSEAAASKTYYMVSDTEKANAYTLTEIYDAAVASGEMSDYIFNNFSEEDANEIIQALTTVTASSDGIQLAASQPGTTPFSATVNGVTYTSLAAAIAAAVSTGKTIEVAGAMEALDSSYTGDVVIDFKSTTLNNSVSGTAFAQVKSGYFNFQNGTINGDGIIVTGTANVAVDNMKINCGTGSAITADSDAFVDVLVNSNIFTGSGTNPIVDIWGNAQAEIGGLITNNSTDSSSCAVQIAGNAKVELKGTVNETGITGYTAIVVKDNAQVTVSGGMITGNGAATGTTAYNGAAIGVLADTAKVNVPQTTVSHLHSYYTGATRMNGLEEGADANNIVVADDDVLEPIAKSNYAAQIAIASVNGEVYATMKDAIVAASQTDAITNVIEILQSFIMQSTDYIDITTENVVINGNDYTIKVSDDFTPVVVEGGSLVLNDIVIDGDGKTSAYPAISASAGTLILEDVTVENALCSLLVMGSADVTVNGFDANYSISGTSGITFGGNATVKVYDCIIKSADPIVDSRYASNGTLEIYQGAFKTSAASVTDSSLDVIRSCKAESTSDRLENGYYYIEAKSVTLEIVKGGDSTGSYLLYTEDTANQIIQFKVSDTVKEVNAVGTDGQIHPISISTDQTSVTSTGSDKVSYVTLDNTSLNLLPAGKYDLQVKFERSGIISLDLYVSPRTRIVYADDETALPVNNTTDNIPVYDAQSGKNLFVEWVFLDSGKTVGKVSDMPLHVGVGADRYHVTWLTDAGFVSSTQYKILHDDIDFLGNGTNYVWLDYGEFWTPVQLNVTNAAASISPTTASWSKSDGDLKFDVWPDIVEIKLGDMSLAKDVDYTYKDGVLTVKAQCLLTLSNGDYKLAISTSKGGVNCDIHIGESLRNNGIDYHVYGGSKSLSFVASSNIDFTKGIWIGKANPVQVDSTYISQTNAKTFALTTEYLNKLTTLGTYYISAYVNGEYCTTTFRIISASEAAYTPTTGDSSNILMWVIILVLAAVILVVLVVPYLRKKKAVPVAAVAAEENVNAVSEAKPNEKKTE